jgi:glutamyl-tRNA reductase
VHVALVANRTYERARAVAEQLGARALTLDEAWTHFATADLVLCSTAAPHAVVTWERVAPAIATFSDDVNPPCGRRISRIRGSSRWRRSTT